MIKILKVLIIFRFLSYVPPLMYDKRRRITTSVIPRLCPYFILFLPDDVFFD
jgi:hypothetical protein